MEHEINMGFLKLPPNYKIIWAEYDELYCWVIRKGDENKIDDLYGFSNCCRFQALRDAWAHYRNKNQGVKT